MKYELDPELQSFSSFSGQMVGRLYPIFNFFYRLQKCKPDENVNVIKYIVPGYEGAKQSAWVVEPKEYTGVLPCIMLYHGGGFLMSACNVHYQLAKWYAHRARCKVVIPDYRLMPKYTYPIAIEDCYSAYLWVVENAEALGIDREKIVVAGDSAGGNIAPAVTMMLKDRGQELPKGAMLTYPAVDKRMITESMKRFTDTPVWDSRCNKMFWDMYLKGQDKDSAKYASIIEADSLAYFPETYVEVAEFDCLRDEGIAFVEKLQSEGVTAEVHEVKGACHGYEAAAQSAIMKKCMNRRLEWIKKIYEATV